MEILNSIINNIENDEKINDKAFVSCMLMQKIEDRLSANYRLSDVFFKKGNFEQAKVHSERAWIFSKFDYKYAKQYVSILENLDDIGAISYVYKQTAMAAFANDCFEQAINLFNEAFYTKAIYTKTDSFEYDFDILRRVEGLGKKFQIGASNKSEQGEKKVKLAYLTYGLADLGSVFAKIIPQFAKYHNKEEFEIVFFVPEKEEQIYSERHSLEVVRAIKAFGCQVVCAPNEQNRFQRWVKTGYSIGRYNPDVFITFAALARFEYYLISSMLPEHVKKVALVYGPPAQFVPPSFDVAIGRSKHPLFDTPIDVYATLPVFINKEIKNKTFDRSVIGIPKNAIILMSVGRYTKFQEALFWEIIEDVLSLHVNAYFVCVGAYEKDINREFNESVASRIVFLGWRSDAELILRCADVYINTFPNGGGYAIWEAVVNKIPIVSFKNNYFKKFDQNEWNPIDEIVGFEDVLFELNDKKSFISVLSKLISDKSYREEIAMRCYIDAQNHIMSPKETMLEYEQTLKMIAK